MSVYQEIQAEALLPLLAKNPPLLVDVRNDDEVARGIIGRYSYSFGHAARSV